MVDVLLRRRGKTSRPCRDLAPQLVPFPTGVKRNFEQCSPSPSATARQGHATRRRSLGVHHFSLSKRRNEQAWREHCTSPAKSLVALDNPDWCPRVRASRRDGTVFTLG